MAWINDPGYFPRVRTSSSPSITTSTPEHYKEYGAAGGAVCGLQLIADWGSAQIRSDWKTKTVRDHVSSDFKRRIARGEIINHPFQSEETHVIYAQPVQISHHMMKSTSLSCSPSGSIKNQKKLEGPVVPPVPSYLGLSLMDELKTSVMNSAVTQAHANIDVSSMLALATAAEARKTVDSVVDISNRAYRILKRVRKLDFRALKKEISLSELSDRYMEARYAIRPLAYDLHGVYSALKEEREYIRRTFRGYASDSVQLKDTLLNQPLVWSMTSKWDRQATYTVSARAGVLCDVNISALTTYGVDQTAESIWELLPFSFVADWFANIGDTIAAWTPNHGVRQRASWVTVRETRTFTNTMTGAASSYASLGYVSATFSAGSTSQTKRELFSERITSPALSTFPQTSLRLDKYKLTDLGIMFRNIFR